MSSKSRSIFLKIFGANKTAIIAGIQFPFFIMNDPTTDYVYKSCGIQQFDSSLGIFSKEDGYEAITSFFKSKFHPTLSK